MFQVICLKQRKSKEATYSDTVSDCRCYSTHQSRRHSLDLLDFNLIFPVFDDIFMQV
jgi:hypothetical protein